MLKKTFCLALMCITTVAAAQQKLPRKKTMILNAVDNHEKNLIHISDSIWSLA